MSGGDKTLEALSRIIAGHLAAFRDGVMSDALVERVARIMNPALWRQIDAGAPSWWEPSRRAEFVVDIAKSRARSLARARKAVDAVFTAIHSDPHSAD